MGLALSNIVGQGVVDAAVVALKNSLTTVGDPAQASANLVGSPQTISPHHDEAVQENKT
ncbi:MAG: hypothetical protein ACJ8AT_34055 [Hyalangium sp.]|uniref:hypothetical protein n=1 Tax=Hyalangium sp. TaxID=2028555 RepID=UPI00389A59CC